MYHANSNHKNAGVVLLIPDNTNLKIKEKLLRNKEGHFIMMTSVGKNVNWKLPTLLMEIQNGGATLKTSLAVPQKLKTQSNCMTQQFHLQVYTQEK